MKQRLSGVSFGLHAPTSNNQPQTSSSCLRPFVVQPSPGPLATHPASISRRTSAAARTASVFVEGVEALAGPFFFQQNLQHPGRKVVVRRMDDHRADRRLTGEVIRDHAARPGSDCRSSASVGRGRSWSSEISATPRGVRRARPTSRPHRQRRRLGGPAAAPRGTPASRSRLRTVFQDGDECPHGSAIVRGSSGESCTKPSNHKPQTSSSFVPSCLRGSVPSSQSPTPSPTCTSRPPPA